MKLTETQAGVRGRGESYWSAQAVQVIQQSLLISRCGLDQGEKIARKVSKFYAELKMNGLWFTEWHCSSTSKHCQLTSCFNRSKNPASQSGITHVRWLFLIPDFAPVSNDFFTCMRQARLDHYPERLCLIYSVSFPRANTHHLKDAGTLLLNALRVLYVSAL